MQFVQKLNYRPKGLETIKLELNYRMIFRLKDTLNFFKTPYDSNIYQGFNCEWQDVFEEWTFKNDILGSRIFEGGDLRFRHNANRE